METKEIFALGLGLQAPWRLLGQTLDTGSSPYKLILEIGADRGAMYPCPACGKLCKAHDFQEATWRHLNFFQHHCHLKARVPRVNCAEHGIHRTNVPWSRPGSGFTLLFEQVVMTLVREMPVSTVARQIGTTDNRLWRIIRYYVTQTLNEMDLSRLFGLGLDETASKRGHSYVTVFVDMDREKRPVVFVAPGKGRESVQAFVRFLKAHGGDPDQIMEVVSDMSPAFLSSVEKEFKYAVITVDWFHVVQLFTHAVDEVRRAEKRKVPMPKAARWALLKGLETERSEEQEAALKDLMERGLASSTAFRVKEMVRWVNCADTMQAAKWRGTHFINAAKSLIGDAAILKPVRKALQTFEHHLPNIIQRWKSLLTTARLEGMNGLFQAARSRARGYRNEANFITMIYLIGSPVADLIKQNFP